MLKKQLLSDWTYRLFAIAFGLHIVAFAVWMDWLPALPLLLVVMVSMVWIMFQKPQIAMALAFFEVFIGGHGIVLQSSIAGFSISLRMAIFLGILFGFGASLLVGRTSLRFQKNRDLPWLILIVLVGLAFVAGILFGNGFGNSFDDANSYAWLLMYIPMITITWTSEQKHMLLQTLFAGALWTMAFTLLLSYLFTHLDGDALDIVYRFIRDSRLFEVTLQLANSTDGPVAWFMHYFVGEGSYWYRIFGPSQLFLIPAALLPLTAFAFGKAESIRTHIPFITGCMIAAVFVSLSRSFLVGAIASGMALGVLYVLNYGFDFMRILKRKIQFIPILAIAIALPILLMAIPVPARPDISDAAFFKTSSETGRSEAVVSRFNLLGPLHDEILSSPVIGKGFGREIAYYSEDPRVIEATGGEPYRTYRFEWGYQDIWLKMGVVGLAGYGFLAFTLLTGLYRASKQQGYSWIQYTLIASIVALFTIHIFSPYLNHPIGIALLLFCMPFGLFDYKVMQSNEKQTPVLKSVLRKNPAVLIKE